MNLTELVLNPFAFGPLTFLAGIASTVISLQIAGRRRLLSYTVVHNRIGLSANDPLFGNVQITWNNNLAANLFLSNIVLTNESLSDFKDVEATLYTSDTELLSQRTQIVDTPTIVSFTAAYAVLITVSPNGTPTQYQLDTYRSRTEI